MFGDFKPKFVKQFGQIGEQMKAAVSAVHQRSTRRRIPGGSSIPLRSDDEMLEKLY